MVWQTSDWCFFQAGDFATVVAETRKWIDTNEAASEFDFKKKLFEVRSRKGSIVRQQTLKRKAEALPDLL